MNFLKHRSFPTFYSEYAPKLVEFFGAWVDWLNEEGNSAYIVDHLSSEHDIDESVDAYKTHTKNKLIADFPETIASDFKLLLKNIFYLYNSKSSISSYEFLFRCLFNSPCAISYPKDLILKTSDGRWTIPYYLQTEGFDILNHLDIYNWFKLEGETSKAICYIDGADIFKNEQGEYENCLRITSVTGTFEVGEHLIMTNPENGEVFNFDDFRVKYYLMDYVNGRWEGTYGMLDSDMIIQDSYYYQDFSYIVQSNVSMHKWKALVKSIIHPAGLEFFGELMMPGGDDSDSFNPKILATNPIAFLEQWHLTLKLYIKSCPADMESISWDIARFNLAQVQSETMDMWTWRGVYEKKDGFYNVNTGYTNTFFNRDSVMLFRDNGTLIDPDIINWATFEFKDDIDTQFLWGTTLHPEKSMVSGDINGNEWVPEYEESYIPENAMVFITQSTYASSKIIRDLIMSDEYMRDNNGNPESYPVKKTLVTDIAYLPDTYKTEFRYQFIPSAETCLNDQILIENASASVLMELNLEDEYLKDRFNLSTEALSLSDLETEFYTMRDIAEAKLQWKNLTVLDYVEIAVSDDEIFDTKSFLKVPDVYVEKSDGKYFFPKRHYENERIVIFNYRNDEVSDILFFDNKLKEQDHVFTLKSVVAKNYILCFVDGKLTENFRVDGNSVIIPGSDYNYAEIYVLAPTEASRKLKQEYTGDRHFVYNNVRKWPYMPFNTHIIKFIVSDYSRMHTYLENEHPIWKINTMNILGHPVAGIISNIDLGYVSDAQCQSETLDDWIYRGIYHKPETVHDVLVDEINCIGNKNSTLVFTKNGKLVDPENINWFEKKIKTTEFIEKTLGSISISDDIMISKNATEVLADQDMTDDIVSDVKDFSTDELGTYDMLGHVYDIDETFIETTEYGDHLYSLPINAESSYIKFRAEGTKIYTLDSLYQYFTKLLSDSYTADMLYVDDEVLKEVAEFDLEENLVQNSDVDLTHIQMLEANLETQIHSVKKISPDEIAESKDSHFIAENFFVFCDGKKVPDGEISTDESTRTYSFKKSMRGEICIFQYSKFYKRRYYTGTTKKITLRNEVYDPRYIVVFVDGYLCNNWKLDGNIITLKEAPAEIAEVYVLNNFSYFISDVALFNEKDGHFAFNNLRKMHVVPTATWLDIFREIETDKIKLENVQSVVLKSLAVLKNEVSKLIASFNITNSGAEPVIPLYNTVDRELYYGTFDVKNFDNLPVYFLEKELNRYSTMLFGGHGYLVHPDNIDWVNVRIRNPEVTDRLTSVVLNSEKPAIIGTINSGRYKSKNLGENDMDDAVLSEMNTMTKTGNNSMADTIVREIETFSVDELGDFATSDEIYYIDESVIPTYTYSPNGDEIIDKNELVFIDGMKVYPSDYTYVNGVYTFSNVDIYRKEYIINALKIMNASDSSEAMTWDMVLDMIANMNLKTIMIDEDFSKREFTNFSIEDFLYGKVFRENSDVVIFQYNENDIDDIIRSRNTTNRFYKLSRNGCIPQECLVFKNGLRTKDYYISGDILCFNSMKQEDFVEIYVFKNYDYLFMHDDKYNCKCKEFVISNIKRISYV